MQPFIAVPLLLLLLCAAPTFGNATPGVPLSQAAGCVREGGHSGARVCDPDHVLSSADKSTIESIMSAVTRAQVAAMIVKRMAPSYIQKVGSADAAAEEFARTIHDHWGLGSRERQDGLLVFLSIDDRKVYISTGAGIMDRIGHSDIQRAIELMKPSLRATDYLRAIVVALLEFDACLTPDGAARETSGALSVSGIEMESASSSGSFLPGLVFLSFIGGIFAIVSLANRRRRKGMAKLQQLLRAADTAEGPVYRSPSCPVCLEDYPDSRQTASPRRATALACGHVFCAACLQTLFRRVAAPSCPICRASLGDGWEAAPGSQAEHYSRMNTWDRQEMAYRAHRITIMYPDALPSSQYQAVAAAAHSPGTFAALLSTRMREVEAAISSASHSHSSSSSSSISFGGGSSGGGGGGSW
eukprot:m.242699 g.242699  ORF g.242699 m.242699 type:complete len:414 (+) comp14090_c0_seq1:3130-4371(+)